MPEGNLLDSVFTLVQNPGIKRDGTVFESSQWTEGIWTRFQRKIPKKMGGYTQLFQTPNGIPRALITQTINGVHYIFAGHSNGIDIFTTGVDSGQGAGPFSMQFNDIFAKTAVVSQPTTATVVVAGDKTTWFPPRTASYLGSKVVFNEAIGATQYTVTAAIYSTQTMQTTLTLNPLPPAGQTFLWRYSDYPFTADPRLLWQFDVMFDQQNNGLQLLAHAGLNLQLIDSAVPRPLYAGPVLPVTDPVTGAQSWQMRPLADTDGQNPTGQQILVDGFVTALYPFIFAGGSNGLLTNNAVPLDLANTGKRTFNDWNTSPLANTNNVAAGKILRGYPLRGGSNSPSGIFWAADSIVRVSFNGGTQAGYSWSYDIVANKISVLSSSSIISADGLFYWLGTDRAYVFNGSVQVLENDFNINYIFDNVNYQQRQKVWGTSIPRYNEIVWFIPFGTSTECNVAIIYNTKDKIWYDTGFAEGARRACGYTTEVFPTPIWAGYDGTEVLSRGFTVQAYPGAPLPAPTVNSFYVSGDQTPVFTPGSYVSLVPFSSGTLPPVYRVSSAVLFTTPLGALFTLVSTSTAVGDLISGSEVFSTTSAGYSIWQHETGVDKVYGTQVRSILASITSSDIAWVGGQPDGDSPRGTNRRMHLVRVEPDFRQSGTMTLEILGRAFSRGPVQTLGPFSFAEDQGKIDTHGAEFRQLRLRFASDEINGNYELGRILLTADYGGERP